MRILILTQPLTTNYGGLLQAYALQKVIKSLGHQVLTDKCVYKTPLIKKTIGFFYRAFKRYVLNQKTVVVRPHIAKDYVSKNTTAFIDEHIDTIDFLTIDLVPQKKYFEQFDGYIVGSDQVWRPAYSKILPYFLDFTKNQNVKRIAYAASFGTDNLQEYDESLISKCSILAKQFDAVSVREDTGVELCLKNFNIQAISVLDPTLLLNKNDYLSLIEEEDLTVKSNILMCYVLDKTKEKSEIIQYVANMFSLEIYEVIAKKHIGIDVFKKNDDFIFPSVSKWLAGFRDAKFVVTDSFHGTVFSIIFNKPFVVILNKERGVARFSSLLKIFNLEYLIVDSVEQVKSLDFDSIDFNIINTIKDDKVKYSIDFLMRNLKRNNE